MNRTPLERYTGASWIKKFLNLKSRKKHIDAALKVLEPIKRKFDTIAFSGMSGALIAPLLADALGKNLVLVRKKSDKTHSYAAVEGFTDIKKYVIVDDLWIPVKR